MNADETNTMAAKTWTRGADPINKIGLMDGALDGRTSMFQSSFDKGYKLGFGFGLELGIKEAFLRFQQPADTTVLKLQDPRRINCAICLDNSLLTQDNITHLQFIQKKSNDYKLLGT